MQKSLLVFWRTEGEGAADGELVDEVSGESTDEGEWSFKSKNSTSARIWEIFDEMAGTSMIVASGWVPLSQVIARRVRKREVEAETSRGQPGLLWKSEHDVEATASQKVVERSLATPDWGQDASQLREANMLRQSTWEGERGEERLQGERSKVDVVELEKGSFADWQAESEPNSIKH